MYGKKKSGAPNGYLWLSGGSSSMRAMSMVELSWRRQLNQLIGLRWWDWHWRADGHPGQRMRVSALSWLLTDATQRDSRFKTDFKTIAAWLANWEMIGDAMSEWEKTTTSTTIVRWRSSPGAERALPPQMTIQFLNWMCKLQQLWTSSASINFTFCYSARLLPFDGCRQFSTQLVVLMMIEVVSVQTLWTSAGTVHTRLT